MVAKFVSSGPLISLRIVPKSCSFQMSVLPEVSYLLSRNLGYANSMNFFDFFDHHFVKLEPIVEADLARVYDIAHQYADAQLDLVDCCIMAIAERLDITRIATFDRRDFGIFQPQHGDFLELLP